MPPLAEATGRTFKKCVSQKSALTLTEAVSHWIRGEGRQVAASNGPFWPTKLWADSILWLRRANFSLESAAGDGKRLSLNGWTHASRVKTCVWRFFAVPTTTEVKTRRWLSDPGSQERVFLHRRRRKSYLEDFSERAVAQLADYFPDVVGVDVPMDVLVLLDFPLYLQRGQAEYPAESGEGHCWQRGDDRDGSRKGVSTRRALRARTRTPPPKHLSTGSLILTLLLSGTGFRALRWLKQLIPLRPFRTSRTIPFTGCASCRARGDHLPLRTRCCGRADWLPVRQLVASEWETPHLVAPLPAHCRHGNAVSLTGRWGWCKKGPDVRVSAGWGPENESFSALGSEASPLKSESPHVRTMVSFLVHVKLQAGPKSLVNCTCDALSAI